VFVPLILRLLQNRRESFLFDVSVREFSTDFLQASTQTFSTTTLSIFLFSAYSYDKLQRPKHISASLKVIRHSLFSCYTTGGHPMPLIFLRKQSMSNNGLN